MLRYASLAKSHARERTSVGPRRDAYVCPVRLRQLLGQLVAAGARALPVLLRLLQMEQNDSDDESVTPTLPGFVRASKPPALPGFVRPASRPKKKTSGADVAAAYRAEVRRPKPSSAAPEPSVAVVGPARMATCAACGATYDPLAREAHEASIAHQLAVGPRTRGRRVMLPEANPGAKLCGNQTSGAPRHRRDNLSHRLISTQVSRSSSATCPRQH